VLVKATQIWAAIATPKASGKSRIESLALIRSLMPMASPMLVIPKIKLAGSHSQGEFEAKGESGKRAVIKSMVTLGRHVSSKSGAEVATDRKDFVKSVRSKREIENFGK
jgi:hypothetical protein